MQHPTDINLKKKNNNPERTKKKTKEEFSKFVKSISLIQNGDNSCTVPATSLPKLLFSLYVKASTHDNVNRSVCFVRCHLITFFHLCKETQPGERQLHWGLGWVLIAQGCETRDFIILGERTVRKKNIVLLWLLRLNFISVMSIPGNTAPASSSYHRSSCAFSY